MITAWPTGLVLIGADDADGLAAAARAVAAEARAGDPVAVIAARRAAPGGAHRAAVVASDPGELAAGADAVAAACAEGRDSLARRDGVHMRAPGARAGGRIAFVFPGEGAQRPGMLAALRACHPPVAEWFARLERMLADLGLDPLGPDLDPPGEADDARLRASERRLLGPDGGSQALLVACLAVEELMRSVGIVPGAVIGHSSGEHAAVLSAGIHAPRDREELFARIAAVTRGQLAAEARGDVPLGRTVAVGAIAPEAVEGALAADPALHLVARNSPNQVVLWGPAASVEAAGRRLTAEGGICMALPFERAYHTPRYAARAAELRREYGALRIAPGDVVAYSCAVAAPHAADADRVRDTMAAQWTGPVRFADTVATAHADGVGVFVEVGPTARLTPFVSDTLRGRGALALATAPAGLEELRGLLATIGRLFVEGVDVDITPILPPVPAPAPAPATALAQPAPAQPSPAPVAHPVPSAAPRERMMAGHTALMEEFLASQERTALALASALAGRPPAVAPRATPPPPPAAELRREAPPLLGTIVEHTERRLYAERVLAVESDSFLRDHAIGGAPSPRSPDLHALPVVPFTVSMAIVAEAARALAGDGLVVAELRDLRGYRWIALDEGPLTLGITAELREAPEGEALVAVRLTLPTAVTDAAPPVAFEGLAVLALSHPVPPAADPVGGDPDADDGGLYAGMFHGPRFRCIEAIDRVDEDGVLARGRRRLPDGDPPDGALDPFLLDGCGQLVAHWLISRTGRDVGVFPFRAERYVVFGELPDPGTRIRFEVAARMPDERTTDADVTLVDESGAAIARLERLQQRAFEFPPAYLRCLLDPATAWLSTPLAEPALLGDGALARRIDPLPPGFMEEGWSIWARVLAHLTLAPSERHAWYALRARADRRVEWLLGRIAAKDAVREIAAREHGLQLAPADIEITTDRRGAPHVRCAALGEGVPSVALAHSRGVVLAAAGPSGTRVGIDVERSDPAGRPRDVLGAFTPTEQRLAMSSLGAVGALWCAKEAAAKASGLGLEGNPRRWPVVAYRPEEGAAVVTHEGERYPVRVLAGPEETIAMCGPLTRDHDSGVPQGTPETTEVTA